MNINAFLAVLALVMLLTALNQAQKDSKKALTAALLCCACIWATLI